MFRQKLILPCFGYFCFLFSGFFCLVCDSVSRMYKLLITTLILLLIALQYRLWVGENSLAHIVRLQQDISVQERANQRLKDRNQVLANEVVALKSGLGAVEERARTDLGMIKENETFFMVIDSP